MDRRVLFKNQEQKARPRRCFRGTSDTGGGVRAAGPVLKASRAIYPFIAKLFAYSTYASERVDKATPITVEIVRRIADQVGFVVLPRRWVVERFFA